MLVTLLNRPKWTVIHLIISYGIIAHLDPHLRDEILAGKFLARHLRLAKMRVSGDHSD
jgi:hypothetical protein